MGKSLSLPEYCVRPGSGEVAVVDNQFWRLGGKKSAWSLPLPESGWRRNDTCGTVEGSTRITALQLRELRSMRLKHVDSASPSATRFQAAAKVVHCERYSMGGRTANNQSESSFYCSFQTFPHPTSSRLRTDAALVSEADMQGIQLKHLDL